MNQSHRARRQMALPPSRNDLRAPDHAQALQISSRIAGSIRRMVKRKAANIEPQDVIRILNQAGIKFVLMGAHGIAGWLDEPRASQDVDVLIQSHHRKAVQAIKKAYPDLQVSDLSAVTRFIDSTNDLSVIDLMKPHTALHKQVPKNTFQVGKSYRIPDLEMALALKYAALKSPTRTMRKKDLDSADFRGMVARNYEIIDLEKLYRFGELASHAGGAEIVQMVEDAHAESGPDPHG